MSTAILLHGITSSGLTWWRHRRDLAELGWTVHTPDLAGHGEHHVDAASMTPGQLADDVVRRFPGGADLLVGHSLGAVVAATIASTRPAFCRALVLEDPPSLNGNRVPPDLATTYLERAEAARRDPEAVRAELRREEPLWAPADIDNVVTGRARVQADVVRASFTGAHWDMPSLMATDAVPTLLLLATAPDTAMTGPDREACLAAATESRVVESGHSIHRDRPALWLAEVTRFAREHGLG